uniref:Uncharacterized protein n=1 Tax=Solanum tuberosum TaxID=4113 RepID=M1DWC2_SOLTU
MGDICEKTPETGKGKGKMHEQSGQILTNRQFIQLVNLLEHKQIQAGNNTSNPAHENPNGGAVNFVGILACYSSISDIGNLSCKCLKLNVDSWYQSHKAFFIFRDRFFSLFSNSSVFSFRFISDISWSRLVLRNGLLLEISYQLMLFKI